MELGTTHWWLPGSDQVLVLLRQDSRANPTIILPLHYYTVRDTPPRVPFHSVGGRNNSGPLVPVSMFVVSMVVCVMYVCLGNSVVMKWSDL